MIIGENALGVGADFLSWLLQRLSKICPIGSLLRFAAPTCLVLVGVSFIRDLCLSPCVGSGDGNVCVHCRSLDRC